LSLCFFLQNFYVGNHPIGFLKDSVGRNHAFQSFKTPTISLHFKGVGGLKSHRTTRHHSTQIVTNSPFGKME
jgi:hypothetical protein